MDRAHRLGQRRTVNVYRLIMRDTLEERIMGLQKFKTDVANAVVNQVWTLGGGAQEDGVRVQMDC
jgi:TATA-binding protein-associated factor